MGLRDHLALYDVDDEEFKILVHDGTRPEIDPVQNIQDLDNGALHNGVEWHRRVARRYGAEIPLPDSTGEILDAWADFFDVERPAGMTDDGFATYIMALITAVATTQPVLQTVFDNEAIHNPRQLGPYLNHSFLGVQHTSTNGVAGCVLAWPNSTLYILFPTIASYDAGKARAARQQKAAGIAMFIGVDEEEP